VLGLAHQAEAALQGQLPPGAEGAVDGRVVAGKTAGRLEPDESRLLDQTLTDLRFRFVQTMPRS
jgi:hypothetical protein